MPEYGKLLSPNPPKRAMKPYYRANKLKTAGAIFMFAALLIAVLATITILIPAR